MAMFCRFRLCARCSAHSLWFEVSNQPLRYLESPHSASAFIVNLVVVAVAVAVASAHSCPAAQLEGEDVRGIDPER